MYSDRVWQHICLWIVEYRRLDSCRVVVVEYHGRHTCPRNIELGGYIG